MRDLTQPPPAINRLQQKEEAKFICSACGKDRNCDCNAPAREKLADKLEQERQASKAYRERKKQEKDEQNQNPRHMTQEAAPRENNMDSIEYGRKQVTRLQKHYGDLTNPVAPPIQYNLLDQVKPPILEMNRPTKEALATWLGQVYRD